MQLRLVRGPTSVFRGQPFVSRLARSFSATQSTTRWQNVKRRAVKYAKYLLVGGSAVASVCGVWFVRKVARTVESTNSQLAATTFGLSDGAAIEANKAGDPNDSDENYAQSGERLAMASHGVRGGARAAGVTCSASINVFTDVRLGARVRLLWLCGYSHLCLRPTLIQGRRVEICTFRRADLTPEDAGGRVIVINAGTIAAARPLALELARQADSPVVTYTHAGLCPLPESRPTLSPPSAHVPAASLNSYLSNIYRTYMGWAGQKLSAYALTGDEDPLFSACALPPARLAADPTSDAESDELAAVLRHVGADQGV